MDRHWGRLAAIREDIAYGEAQASATKATQFPQSDDCRSSWQLSCNLMGDPEAELPSYVLG